jgi:hypothetical protein
MVTRWREAHPDLVGTEEDCVLKTMNAIAKVLGVEDGDKANSIKIPVGSATVLLLFKHVGVENS